MAEYNSFGEYRYSQKGGATTALTFLFIGVGIGTIVALLFAPQTGKKMRKTLRRKYEDARDAFEDINDQAGDYVNRAGDYVSRGREWAGAAKEKVAPIAKKFRR